MGFASYIATQEQRSINADKTSENQSQDAYHSAEDVLDAELKDETKPILLRIKFLPAFDTKAWCMPDNIISKTT